MTMISRNLLLVLTFILVAGSLLAAPAAAKPRRGPLDGGSRAPSALALPGDPCAVAESVLNGFLPEIVTLKKTSTYWAKLTVGTGPSIQVCAPPSTAFEVKFTNVKLRQYGKVPYVGGWNSIAPTLSCSLRVGFSLGFAPPNTAILSNLKVLAVNCANSPNWLDNTVVKDGLNKIFPSTIAFRV